jgi:uncharacterized protein YecE (DUF72 family)
VRYGTAGWSYADWYGPFYPVPPAKDDEPLPLFGGRPIDPGAKADARLARENPLAWYARWFDAVEVDASFYRVPAAKNVEKWVATTERGARPFLFSFKLPQTLTHEDAGLDDAAPFREAVRPAVDAGRLAAALAQFPWSFRNEPASLDRIARIQDALPGVALALEVRHASWDDEDARAWLAARGIALAAVDQPRLRDCLRLRPVATAPLAYLRLHGRNRHAWWAGARRREPDEEKQLVREARAAGRPAPRDARYDYLYSEDEVDELASAVDELALSSELVLVIANNHYRGQAPANALELRARREKVAAPPTLARSFPRLASLAGV